MTVEQHQQKDIVTFSDSAQKYIQSWIKRENGIALRFDVKDSGCNGLAYITDIISELDENDIRLDLENLIIMIDPASIKYISGLHVDYLVAENNLGLKKLVFQNPNASGECGCGESFNVDDPS